LRLLLVEDESEMAKLVASLIAEAGYGIDHVRSIADAIEAVRLILYDLVLLDLRLPDGDGMTMLPALRDMRPGIRVIMLTARDKVDDMVSGLEAGADDYLTKPFRGPELIARVRACLRRPGGRCQPPAVIGALTFDLQTREVLIGGRPIVFHPRELALLEALARRMNRVVPRGALFQDIFGFGDTVHDNALDALVSRVRRRLTDLGSGVTIHPVRGIGYVLTEADS
jgi:DNA-binding response OmpR family regulator